MGIQSLSDWTTRGVSNERVLSDRIQELVSRKPQPTTSLRDLDSFWKESFSLGAKRQEEVVSTSYLLLNTKIL